MAGAPSDRADFRLRAAITATPAVCPRGIKAQPGLHLVGSESMQKGASACSSSMRMRRQTAPTRPARPRRRRGVDAQAAARHWRRRERQSPGSWSRGAVRPEPASASASSETAARFLTRGKRPARLPASSTASFQAEPQDTSARIQSCKGAAASVTRPWGNGLFQAMAVVEAAHGGRSATAKVISRSRFRVSTHALPSRAKGRNQG